MYVNLKMVVQTLGYVCESKDGGTKLKFVCESKNGGTKLRLCT